MKSSPISPTLVILCLVTIFSPLAGAQKDPGPRGAPAGAGGPVLSLNTGEKTFFSQALMRFQQENSVSGTISGEEARGLGPSFNSNGCATCHAEPAIGGTSPGPTSRIKAGTNPLIAIATLDGATNVVPSFIKADGPAREARFISYPDGSPDGGVHDLFTIAGRTDAPGCTLAQPDFASALAAGNVSFRIPTPLFGLGLVESTPDSILRANLAATATQRARLGIGGSFNTSANDGTLNRFGWKAQNKSLLVFSGEAYNVEQGVSNENFSNDRVDVPGCVFNGTPEDFTNLTTADGATVGDASSMSSDLVNFAAFMMLAAPPTPAIPAGISAKSVHEGQELFNSVGCSLCHSPTLTTGPSKFAGMSNVIFHPFSDFALHHMGPGLADHVTQGLAGPDQFRTAPLWGVGQRLFFMHDGRTSDLLQAIQDHATWSGGPSCRQNSSMRSEADGVVRQFNHLSPQQQQAILNFLRSL
ncbi:MAG TPA: di-heme oxidoredictase family protein [Terriglobales bacterium]|nr:di-heme oxidoredictase family protein [Terriglobales bacterium]